MYLFSRRTRLAPGNGRAGLEWAVEMTGLASTITGLPIGLYGQVYSPAYGTLAWSTFIADLATLEQAGDALMTSDEYVAMSDRGAQLTIGGMDDGLTQIVHGEPDPDREINYVSVVRAVTAGGNAVRGITVGVEIAQRAEAATGLPTMFGTDVTGTYGGVGWLTGYEDAGAVEAAQQKLAADPGWLEYVDREAGTAYVEEPGFTTQLMYRRLV